MPDELLILTMYVNPECARCKALNVSALAKAWGTEIDVCNAHDPGALADLAGLGLLHQDLPILVVSRSASTGGLDRRFIAPVTERSRPGQERALPEM